MAQAMKIRPGTLTDASGAITAGGTAQPLLAANADRKYLLVQNLDATNALWINFGVDAVADKPSIKVAAGATFLMENSFIDTRLVSILGGTTGTKFTAKEGA